MDLADAVSPSEKWGSEWSSSSSGSTRKRVLRGEGSGRLSRADMRSRQVWLRGLRVWMILTDSHKLTD